MAQQRPKKPYPTYDDEIDLFEVLRFLVQGTRFWVTGGVLAGLIALVYCLTVFPTTHRQQTVNDVGLTVDKLVLIRQMMPALTFPLKDEMQAQGLGRLYNNIVKNDQFLAKIIQPLSGVDLKQKNLSAEEFKKIDAIRILLKGEDVELLQRENQFLKQSLRGLSQYVELKQWIDNRLREAKLQLFNTEAQVNEQQLSYERAERQFQSYQKLQTQSKDTKDLQIILNLSNQETMVDDKTELNNISEFSAAKYLPLANQLLAIKSEMVDQLEAIQIAKQQIQSTKLSQRVLLGLAQRFEQLPYQADVLDLTPLFQVVSDARINPNLSLREIGALDDIERNLLAFERSGLRLNNSLPPVVEKKGRFKVVIVTGVLGGVAGFVYYIIMILINAYRRRYY